MGFKNFRELVDAMEAGRGRYTTWRKAPSQATVAGQWFDLSMSPGNPIPNYYASTPLVAATLNGGEGLFHAGSVAPATKHVVGVTALTPAVAATPLAMILCDYLLYYPFVDQSVTDPQIMDNSVTLPRYQDGAGVQMMAVMVAPQVTGGATFQVQYTNQDGVTGRLTPVMVCNTGVSNGTILTTAPVLSGAPAASPFIPLQGSDTGVRAIENVVFFATDVGLLAFVLAVPLHTHAIREITAPNERQLIYNCPRVRDGAYLNWLVMPSASLAATQIHGDLTVAWN